MSDANIQATPSTESAATPVEAAATPAAEPKKYKVKIDGNEVEVDETELQRGYARSAASMKRFEEANRLKTEAEQLLELPKKDLKAFLKKQGMDPQQVAEMLLLQSLEEATVDPEKEELEKYRAKDKEEAERKRAEEEQQAVAEASVAISQRIGQALEITGLSKDPYTLRSAALFYKSCVKAGFEPDPEEIVEAVEGRTRNDYSKITSSLDGEQLVKWLGDELVNRIRKYDLSRLKAGRQQPDIPKAQPQQEARKPQKLDKWQLQQRVKEWSQS